MQFVDVKNDIAFRKIFGNAAKTEILISFLNAVLKLESNHQINWVEIINPYQLPLVLGGRSSILDVRAKDITGREYIIEMQMTDKTDFPKRIIYYSAKSYSAQMDEGDNYMILKPVIFIGILNFKFLNTDNYLSRHLILDAETKEHKLKDLDFNFIELPKFNKTEGELKNMIDKWVYFIKNVKDLEIIPKNANDNGLKAAYTEAKRHRWTKKDREAYDYANMRDADYRNEQLTAQLKGEAIGELRGKLEQTAEIARNLINLGLDNGVITQATGLSNAEIQQLRNL